MALNANALTTLATAKAYLKIPTGETSQDSIVELFINSASQMLETECDRLFKSQAITEKQHGRGQNFLLLKQWPVTAVAELRIDREGVFTDPSTLIDAADYQITDDGNGIVLLHRSFQHGYNNVRIQYTAGFATVPADLEEACLWTVTWKRGIRDAGDIGRQSKSKDTETVQWLQEAPKDVTNTILRYKRTEFLAPNVPVHNL